MKRFPPPPSTTYRVDDGQIVVPAAAAERGGIQPVIVAKANGGVGTETLVNRPVQFSAVVEVPPHIGKIVSLEWDFERNGDFPVVLPLTRLKSNASGSRVKLTAAYTFTKPGTYFPTLRATSQRKGDAKSVSGRISNLGTVRVAVK